MGEVIGAILDRKGLGRNVIEAERIEVRLAMLSGGVGGARLARGLAAIDGVDLTVIVNVGDDDEIYGLSVAPDLDTVAYTLAGIEGPQGWGLVDDSHTVMAHLDDFGVDTRFRIGDGDLAMHLYRSMRLRDGALLSEVTTEVSAVLDVPARILPVTDDRLRTEVRTEDGVWRSFQEYFVLRGHADEVADLRFAGSKKARPAAGVIEALQSADALVIGPSNPPLSIWPILSVREVTDAVASARRVVAVSPLFGGRALKGPADRVLASLGLPPGNEGVLAAYDGLISDLIIDRSDAGERGRLTDRGVGVHVRDTRFSDVAAARDFGNWLAELL